MQMIYQNVFKLVYILVEAFTGEMVRNKYSLKKIDICFFLLDVFEGESILNVIIICKSETELRRKTFFSFMGKGGEFITIHDKFMHE